MPQYTIFRILGDESPPRDTPGRRLEALRWILANEPDFPDCARWWVVNVAADNALRQEYLAVLADARASFTVRNRDWTRYPRAGTHAERVGFIMISTGPETPASSTVSVSRATPSCRTATVSSFHRTGRK